MHKRFNACNDAAVQGCRKREAKKSRVSRDNGNSGKTPFIGEILCPDNGMADVNENIILKPCIQQARILCITA